MSYRLKEYLISLAIVAILFAVFQGYVFAESPTPTNPLILLKDFDAQWNVTPDGQKVCVLVDLVDVQGAGTHESLICWEIPKDFLHQIQT